MPLLLDTQIVIWLESNDSKLSKAALNNTLQTEKLWLSKVSVWEMAIKAKTNKLFLKQPINLFVANFLNAYNVQILDITLPHIYQTQELPLHHRDPFDRLLIAQALVENISIVSSDPWFDNYEIERIW